MRIPVSLLAAMLVLLAAHGLAASPACAHETVDAATQTLSIDGLPREVRAGLEVWKPSCGQHLSASPLFARMTKVGSHRYLTLHFEQLACVNRSAICHGENCRHEVYAFSQGRYRRVLVRHTRELALRDQHDAAVLELDCGPLGCLRALRWDGHAFRDSGAESIETEHLFGFAEGADVGEKGEWESETTFTGRFGKPGRYAAIEAETALRNVWADRLRSSLTLFADAHDIHRVPGLQDVSVAAFNGVGGELRWQALTRATAPIDLALSFEPQWHRLDGLTGLRQEAYGLPMILLADVAIVPERLFAAVNVNYTPAVARVDGAWQPQSNLELSAALAVALQPHLFVGAELRHLSAYQGAGLDSLMGAATYLGPSLYLALPNEMIIKMVWSAQAAGHAPAAPSATLDLVNFERQQARLQIVKKF